MTQVFIDESIHGDFGFIASALVFDRGNVESRVRTALEEAGLCPGRDEYKSGRRMDGNQNLQALRDNLLGIAGREARIAMVFTPSSERDRLGEELLHHLALTCQRSGITTAAVEAFFDGGIFSSVDQGHRLAASSGELSEARLHFEQDSRSVFGIQVADAIAHTLSQVLKQDLSGKSRTVLLGEKEGYPEGTPSDLGWILLMGLRHALLHRPVVYESERHSRDPESEPQVIPDTEDLVVHAQHPDLFGWGVFTAPSLPEDVQDAIKERFAKIWLGCTH